MTKVFIIAEIGSIHDGSLGNAKCAIDAAAACGVDAVKFQTHIAAAETLKDAPMPPYFKGEPRYEYFERTGFTEVQWRELKAHAEKAGVAFISSPFSMEAVDLLERIGVDQYKIPSGEVTNLPMLAHIAATGKPVILSSGMSNWQELDAAVAVIKAKHKHLTVLQCTSAYPCTYEQVGLNVMQEMQKRYNCPVGLSDHTNTIFASIVAAALGATVVEKHFTFSRLMYGSDAKNSLEPSEMRQMVEGIRATEKMLAHSIDKDDITPFAEMKNIFEKSVVTTQPIAAGEVFTAHNIALKKPGGGIPPSQFNVILGQRATRAIPADRLLTDEDVEDMPLSRVAV